jgi:hypothetical protein
MRAAGWIIWGGGFVAGFALTLTANKGGEYDWTQFGVGVGVMVVGSIIGLVLALKRDEVSFTVTPLTVGSPRVEGRALWAGAPAEGLALTARF